MRKATIVAVVALFWAVAPAISKPNASGTVAVMGAGANSCGTWTTEHQAPSARSTADDEWVLGYLTGVNSFGAGSSNISGNIDNAGVLAWVTNYCTSHPLDPINIAASSLVFELYAEGKTEK